MTSPPSRIVIEKFRIIVVDDRPDSITSHMKKVEAHVRENNLEPDIVYDRDGSKLEKSLKNDDIDIIATDMNIKGLGGKEGGKVIIQMVRGAHNLTDILFYSAGDYDPDQIRKETGHYAFIEYCERDDLDEYLNELIDRNLARLKDIVFLRGIVISKVIDLEYLLNGIVARHFGIPLDMDESFQSLVMENRSYQLEGRIEVLKRIMESRGILVLSKDGKNIKKYVDARFDNVIQLLKNLRDARNLLAHCRRDKEDTNTLISFGKPVKFTRKDLIDIIGDARKAADMLETLNDEFSFNLRKMILKQG